MAVLTAGAGMGHAPGHLSGSPSSVSGSTVGLPTPAPVA